VHWSAAVGIVVVAVVVADDVGVVVPVEEAVLVGVAV